MTAKAPQTITPSELQRRIRAGDALVLLDVREPNEFEFCHIAGSRSIPLGELGRRLEDLDPTQTTICICHHGTRSANAAAGLVRSGFQDVFNLRGGVEDWALEVEPAMPRY